MLRIKEIFDLILVVFSMAIFLASLKLGFGTLHHPGSGFMPCISSFLVFFFTLIILINDLIARGKDEDKEPFFVRRKLQKPVILVVALCGYAFLLNILGYLVTSFLLIFVMLLIFDFDLHRWWKYSIIGAGATILSYLIFCKWFQVQLPDGLFQIRF